MLPLWSSSHPFRIEGQYYDWPVGFHAGLTLENFWQLEEHKLGETTFTHFADGTAHKNRMQQMYRPGEWGSERHCLDNAMILPDATQV